MQTSCVKSVSQADVITESCVNTVAEHSSLRIYFLSEQLWCPPCYTIQYFCLSVRAGLGYSTNKYALKIKIFSVRTCTMINFVNEYTLETGLAAFRVDIMISVRKNASQMLAWTYYILQFSILFIKGMKIYISYCPAPRFYSFKHGSIYFYDKEWQLCQLVFFEY